MFLPILLSLLGTSDAQAASDIEFKTSGPVLIYIDGQQATLTSKLKQRITGIDAGTHEVRVTGVFGKTLFEAEMDIPDNTLTFAEWGHGELKVLRTEWLDEVDEDDDGDEVEEVAAELPAEEPMEQIQVLEPEAAPEVATAPLAVPAAAPEPVEEGPGDAVAAAPVVEAEPIAQAGAVPVPVAGGATRTLTVQAQDGMRIEVQHNGQSVFVHVKDGTFHIVDPNGFEMALSSGE